MAKPTSGLATSRKIADGVLTIVVTAMDYVYGPDGKLEKSTPVDGQSFERSVDLTELLGEGWGTLSEIGQSAAELGLGTALRNSTAGSTLSEAQERMDAILESWQEGQWTARRASGIGAGAAFPASSDWVAALAQVYPQHFADKPAAAQWLNSQIDSAAWTAFTDDEKAAARKAVREKLKGDVAVKTACEAIAAARKAKKATAPVENKPLFS